jgi:hypothetical protein
MTDQKGIVGILDERKRTCARVSGAICLAAFVITLTFGCASLQVGRGLGCLQTLVSASTVTCWANGTMWRHSTVWPMTSGSARARFALFEKLIRRSVTPVGCSTGRKT